MKKNELKLDFISSKLSKFKNIIFIIEDKATNISNSLQKEIQNVLSSEQNILFLSLDENLHLNIFYIKKIL